MSIHTRLQHLEKLAPKATCPACRHRSHRTMFVITRRLADGTWLPQETTETTLERCSLCGHIPERIIEVLETMVETRAEAAQVLAYANAPRLP